MRLLRQAIPVRLGMDLAGNRDSGAWGQAVGCAGISTGATDAGDPYAGRRAFA